MAAYVDPYIALHFEDLIVPAGGGTERYVARLKDAQIEALRGTVGINAGEAVKIPGSDDRSMVAFSASPIGRRQILDAERVETMQATGRREWVPVLLRLRNSGWHSHVEGFTLGSRLGNILTGRATEPAIRRLQEDPEIIAIEASRVGGTEECATSMPFVGATAAHAPPLAEKGAGAHVAVIDSGIDVLHHAFRDAQGQSRVLLLWDQRDNTGPSPQTYDPYVYEQAYGTVHTRADITSYFAINAFGKNLGRDPGGHGTHVASIAAGSPVAATGFPGGVAPEADLVIVIPQLHATPSQAASIGYSNAHVDALAFVRATARAAGAPVVVNVSQGMNAGAHDGSSLLEVAFDAFSGGGREPGYVVVKSAGNESGYGGHANVRAFAGGIASVEWTSTAAPRVEDYLEFWFAACDDLRFTLTAPGGGVCSVDRQRPDAYRHDLGGAMTVYLVLTRFHEDNGDNRLLVLVRNSDGGSLQTAGSWRLDIEGRTVFSDGTVHGWIERDAARALAFRTGAADGQTLSIPGTARTVISVGACQSSSPLVLSANSSRGPTRDGQPKPDLVAPGVDIQAARAGTADGLMGKTGTSMAAPHVTGAVALLLARRARLGLPQLNAVQVRAGLRQSLMHFNGRWQEGFGHGCLNVGELLNAF